MHARLGLVEFLNEEALAAATLPGPMTDGTRRRILRAAVSGRYAFPFRLSVRGYVTGSRDVAGPMPLGHSRGVDGERGACGHYLEVAPIGISKEAFELLGPFLVPMQRRLEPGSVLSLEVEVLDPAGYEVQPAGLFTRVATAKIEVAVEP